MLLDRLQRWDCVEVWLKGEPSQWQQDMSILSKQKWVFSWTYIFLQCGHLARVLNRSSIHCVNKKHTKISIFININNNPESQSTKTKKVFEAGHFFYIFVSWAFSLD